MRLRNTIRNSIVSLTFQVITLLIGFIVPSLVISAYGSEINGLTSNITQIISIINLLQAGIVGASIFEMYKPIIDNDYQKIGRIYYSSLRNFKRLSIYFLVLTLLIIPYILLGKKTTISNVDVILSVLILGINATFIFRYYCSYDVIFSAFQKKYILVLSTAIEKIVYYVLLFIILYFKFHFLLMYIAVLIGSILRILFLTSVFNKLYKDKIYKYRNDENYYIPNQKKLFGNQVIQNIIETSPTVLVTSMYGLVYASILSVYMLVINVFKMIFSTFQNAIAASFGDLIAYNDSKRILKIFNLIQFIFTFSSILLYFCLLLLLLPFVKLYCINIENVNYVYFNLAISMTFYIISYSHFLPFNLMINSFGYYGKVLKNNIYVFIISLCISFIFCLIDFQYVYLGIGAFYLISSFNRYYILLKNNVTLNHKNIYRILITYFIVFSSIPFVNSILKYIISWKDWVIVSLLIFLFSSIIMIIYVLIFERNEIKNLKDYILSIKRGALK